MPLYAIKPTIQPRAPLTRLVDLSPSTRTPPPWTTRRESGDLFWRFGFTSHSDRKWDAGIWRGRVGAFAIVGRWKRNEKAGKGDAGRDVFVGPRDIWYTILPSGEYRRRRFIDCRSAIRRTLRWTAMESAEFFDRRPTGRSDRPLTSKPRPLRSDEPVYVMGRLTIAWRIVRFTRVARRARELPNKAAFDLTPPVESSG